jgi:predicted methyltransferase
MSTRLSFALAGALALAAFGAVAPVSAVQAASAEQVLAAAVQGEWRKPEDVARDQYRHPVEALEFWGLKPGMTILEVQPGGGYWTEILAPFARATNGQYYATGADLDNPETPEAARKGRADFEARLLSKPELYGKPKFVNWGAKSAPLPADTFDFILAARTVHGWMGQGITDKVFQDLYHGLKPGGILAIEQHRAKPGDQDPRAPRGYVTQAYVIDMAKKAGFELVAASEINANPKDTTDHPFGVWTLQPTRRSGSPGAQPDPNFDRAKYDAIGESDRMTLKFTKPR